MKIVPIAFDSLGARSMATYIETGDAKIIIDPSVALGPRRYGLPPHPIEIERKMSFWEKIEDFVLNSEVVIITHYHYDHHNPEKTEIFRGKRLFLKHPEERINLSQRNRASYFLSLLENVDIEYADGKSFCLNDTLIEFSPAVPHGANSRLGFVVMVRIDDGKTSFIHTSDVEGASLEDQMEWLKEREALTVFMDGPMTYMLGYRFSGKSLEKSIESMNRIMESGIKELVVDHHLTRDIEWRNRLSEVFERGEELGVKVMSAAEYLGLDDDLLEARRKELYSLDQKQ